MFRTAVQDGQAVNACKFAKTEYLEQTRRAKRAYTKYQKAAFLDKLFNKNPDYTLCYVSLNARSQRH